VDGVAFRSHSQALTQGMTTTSANIGRSSYDVLNPAANAGTRTLLESGVWRAKPANGQGLSIGQTLASGAYDVSFWIAENYRSNHRDIDVRLEGATVATAIGDLPLGSWVKYGPYRVTVGDGRLDIDVLRRSKGDPHVAALLI